MKNTEWYELNYVLYNILNRCYGKEISYTAIRRRDLEEFHIKSKTVASLNYLRSILSSSEYDVTDFFASLSNYDINDFRLFKGKQVMKDYFTDIKPESFDISFDLDGKIGEMAQEAKDLAKHLQIKGFKTEVIFSGKKGFHVDTDIVFPSDSRKEDYGISEWRDHCLDLAEDFKIDESIYCARREWRVPYTLHGSTGYVVLPLKAHQLQRFIEAPNEYRSSFTPTAVHNMIPLYNRGRVWYESKGD